MGSLTLWFPGRITCRGKKEKEDGLAYKYPSSKVKFWRGMSVMYRFDMMVSCDHDDDG